MEVGSMSPAVHRIAVRSLITLVIAGGILVALAGPAEAQRRQSRSSGMSSFEANKTFGLGIILGSPTGLSAKYYLSGSTALDFALGLYRRYRYDDAVQAHVDFLWHPAVLAETEPFMLPFYVGLGGRLLHHDRYRDRDFDDGTHLGVRVPIGLLMDFNTVPIDIFFELALVVDFIVDHDHGYVDFDGAIGARFYF
jgi:hypothetical protein